MTVYVASDEFTVNTTYARTQAQSDITQLADGNMLVVWVDADFNTTANRYIRAQVYSPDGTALSPELTLKSGSAYIQPEVAALPNGTFVLSWDSLSGIQAQVFLGNGTPLSPVLQVSPVGAGSTSDSDVVALAGGGFAISWEDERTSGGDTSRLGIHVRTYDASGNPIGDTLVNVATSGNQQDPAITALPDGGFVVTWSDHGTPGSWAPRQIKGRTFDANGNPTGGEFLIGSPADGSSSVESSVTTLENGNFAVAWWQNGLNRIQIFDPSGTAVGPQIAVPSNYGGSNPVVGPELIALADGGFAISWIANAGSQSDGSGTGIYVQAFDAAGQPAMAPTLVNAQTNGDQLLPALAALPDGGFMVSWTDLNGAGADDDQVMARIFAPQAEGMVVNGTAASDMLAGGSGNDMIDGGAGTDTMIGGAGDDIYVVDSAGDIVTENAGEGTDMVRSSVSHTLRDNVENLVLTGANNSVATGNGLANTLTGNSGFNRLYGLGGDDILLGNEGGDTLDGGAGSDAMTGGTGDDSYYVDSIGDTVTELANEGNDTVNSTIGYTLGANLENLTLLGSGNIDATGNDLANRLTGNGGNNWLQGGAGADRLVGYGGGDILDGGAGIDTMYGGTGSDIYIFDTAGDQAVEKAGEGWLDMVHSYVTATIPLHVEILALMGSSDLIAFGNQYDNELQGNDGANGLYGRAGSDTLRGNAGDDLIKGEDGDDVLWGGAGRDDLYGGAGADSFSFGIGDFAGLTASTCDRIFDFGQAQADSIRLDEVDANEMDFGDQQFAFIGDAAFSGAAGELRAYQDDANTYVEGDTDGDGVADFMIRLDGLHSLSGSDFLL